MKRCAIVLAVLSLPAFAQADRWVEVSGGAFNVSPDDFARIQGSLQSEVAAAIVKRGHKPEPWSGYLIQYRGRLIDGERTIEVHGSCSPPSAKFDVRSAFYDEQVLDGGECFFSAQYSISTRTYSSVAFHGYA